MLVATPCAKHAREVLLRIHPASPTTQFRLVIDKTFTLVVIAPCWGAGTAQLLLRGEALVCLGSQNS